MHLLEKIFENKPLMATCRKVAYVAMGLLVVWDFFIHRHHEYFWWDKVTGFSSILGFVSCVIIILGSKWLGKVWLQKEEDYYEKDCKNEEN